MAEEPIADVHVPQGPTSLQGDETFSLLNFVGDRLREAIAAIPEHILDIEEKQLKDAVKPTQVDHSLRVSFWREYEKVVWTGAGKITSISVFAGICSNSYWYNKFLKNPRKVAWLVRPLQAYTREMESILHRGTERLWELMEIPIKVQGKFSARNAEILLKTIKQVEDRVKGMAVQRKESKTLRVNLSAKSPQAVEGNDAMEARIRQLEAELGEMPATPFVPAPVAALPPVPESIVLSAARVLAEVAT